ncbi:helix-turn-helix transcriptional regulator [Streptomyces sp. ME02-6987-2C]|uniref:helix-turn-helix domain-containing protein n=1 Tax=unclassified Streptomyces TaxID=2593676 RepID=UPI0029A3FC31|nr:MULTISPECIES: helix-turn-helix transcriptional regulator [unclassified Streptomyces]MDX3345995.1 helix-turn-helix transcriptional regulator [Streptomyces sp. ME02-6979A]MDX3368907.1 helix-turn-helix transcriptional regulator [Streptomyces sp. ME02-6987-2C]MDX3407804.1 helix-turn-helix transcriptional regulator [Streptomyces sp. ME02-6977A]MDX3421761.1 helix-turn-helix transcriptional regulator [Streptomyces sp. ME02-6985-2c]
MRSKGSPERTAESTGVVALGRLVAKLAVQARPEPYDLTTGGTGRRRLAEDAGMSVWAVGRMLRGETLPKPENIGGLAAALGVDEDLLLDTAGYRNRSVHAKAANQAVLSVANPPSPEAIADELGVTHSFVRKMLISSINEAMRLQREADQAEAGGDTGGTAVAR